MGFNPAGIWREIIRCSEIADEAVKNQPDLIAHDPQPPVIQEKGSSISSHHFLVTQGAAGVQELS